MKLKTIKYSLDIIAIVFVGLACYMQDINYSHIACFFLAGSVGIQIFEQTKGE